MKKGSYWDDSRLAGQLALELRQISVVAGVPFRGSLHELQELAQGFALSRLHVGEFYPYPEAGIGAGDDAVQHQPLDPDLSAGDPETDLDFRAGLHHGWSFHQASAEAGIGQVAPHRRGRTIHPQLHHDETLDARIAPAVLSPRRGENIRFKRRAAGGGRSGRRWLRRRRDWRRT